MFFKGSGDTKALEPNESGIGPGRFMALHQTILLKEAIEKLKSHLRLPHLRLALGVNDNKGRLMIPFVIRKQIVVYCFRIRN